MPNHFVTRRARRQARALLDEGDAAAASGVLSVAICREPECGELWACRAQVRAQSQDWPAALADIETALTLTPLSPEAQLLLGDCYLHHQQRDLALTAYEHLLSLGELSDLIYAGLYQGLKACQRLDLALAACRQATQVNPRNHQAHFATAHCLVACRGDVQAIAGALRQAVELAPEIDAYRISLAIRLSQCGEHLAAHQQLSQVDVDSLRNLRCACSTRHLRAACHTAGDSTLCNALDESLAKLRRDRRSPGGA